MFRFRTSLGPVDLAFTDRLGGVSGVPYDELNLALEDADDPRARAENLRRVLAAFAPGDEYADLRQVHGNTVVMAVPGTRAEADGIVTVAPALTLLVRAADCVPVLLADPAAGVIGAVHAGRPGMVAGVVPASVTRMRELGATRINAWIGPHICGSCYEVPAALQAEVVVSVPESLATTGWGTPALDIGAGVRAQLETSGVTVHDASACTRESPNLYSYRRDGERAGRIAGLIRLSTTGATEGRPGGQR